LADKFSKDVYKIDDLQAKCKTCISKNYKKYNVDPTVQMKIYDGKNGCDQNKLLTEFTKKNKENLDIQIYVKCAKQKKRRTYIGLKKKSRKAEKIKNVHNQIKYFFFVFLHQIFPSQNKPLHQYYQHPIFH